MNDSQEVERHEDYGIFLADAPAPLRASRPTRRSTPHLSIIVRIGLASLFIVNGITAIVRPSEFLGLVRANPILGLLPDDLHLALVRAVAIPDFVIAGLIGARRNDEVAAIAMGLWMGAIALTKAMNLLAG